jgi:hypothetical protein
MTPSLPTYTLGSIHPNKRIHAFLAERTLCGVRLTHAPDFVPAPDPILAPTCKRCLALLYKRAAVPSPTIPTSTVAPTPPEITFTSFMAWEETMDHLFSAMRRQVARLGTTDANPALALEFTLLPLLRRYMLGDRSPELYQSIWHLAHP